MKNCPICNSQPIITREKIKYKGSYIFNVIYCPNHKDYTLVHSPSTQYLKQQWNENVKSLSGKKPCPFCGSREIITVQTAPFDSELNDYRQVCTSCGARGGKGDKKAWNTRTKE
jgi:C4-type Zn-finger protein